MVNDGAGYWGRWPGAKMSRMQEVFGTCRD